MLTDRRGPVPLVNNDPNVGRAAINEGIGQTVHVLYIYYAFSSAFYHYVCVEEIVLMDEDRRCRY